MHMIRPQPVRPHFNIVSRAPLDHRLKVTLVIFIKNERLLPTVSPLSDLVRQISCDNLYRSAQQERLKSP